MKKTGITTKINHTILLVIYTIILLTGIVKSLPFSSLINNKIPKSIDQHESGQTREELSMSESWISRYYGILWTVSIIVMILCDYKNLTNGNYKGVPFILINIIAATMGLLTNQYDKFLDIIDSPFKYGCLSGISKLACGFIPNSRFSKQNQAYFSNIIMVIPASLILGYNSGYLKHSIIGVVSLILGYVIRKQYYGKVYIYDPDSHKDYIKHLKSQLEQCRMENSPNSEEETTSPPPIEEDTDTNENTFETVNSSNYAPF